MVDFGENLNELKFSVSSVLIIFFVHPAEGVARRAGTDYLQQSNFQGSIYREEPVILWNVTRSSQGGSGHCVSGGAVRAFLRVRLAWDGGGRGGSVNTLSCAGHATHTTHTTPASPNLPTDVTHHCLNSAV